MTATEGRPPAAQPWQALRKTALRKTSTAELCADGRLTDGGADVRLERWWVRERRDELLRLSHYEAGGQRSSKPLYLSEAELVGVLDAAWEAGVFSDFFKRQLFMLVANRFEGEA